MPNHIAILVFDPGSSIQQHPLKESRKVAAADVAHAPEALGAFPAGDHPGHPDVVSLLYFGHTGPDIFDNTGALVTGNQGKCDGDLTELQVQIRVAVARMRIFNQDFMLLGWIQFQCLNTVRLIGFS